MAEIRIVLEDGKYTYVRDEEKGAQHALRYGQPWRDLTGDKFIYCLAAKVEELQKAPNVWHPVEKLEELIDWDKIVLVSGFNGNDPAKGRWFSQASYHEGVWLEFETGEPLYPPTHFMMLEMPNARN